MYNTELLKLTALMVFAYGLGSIPWGLVLTRKFTAFDIRGQGSGNIGAANVKRVAGLKLGLLTLAGDFLKGTLPVLLARVALGPNVFESLNVFEKEMALSLVAASAFSGHLDPVFLKFKSGGKGVATAAGCFLVLAPIAFCISIAVYILVVRLFRRASLGSLAASAVLPVAVLATTRSAVITGCAAVITAGIYYRHKDNIGRLLSGTEPEIWGKKGK